MRMKFITLSSCAVLGVVAFCALPYTVPQPAKAAPGAVTYTLSTAASSQPTPSDQRLKDLIAPMLPTPFPAATPYPAATPFPAVTPSTTQIAAAVQSYLTANPPPAGSPGAIGPVGPIGNTGPVGNTGVQGIQGVQGNQGIPGPTPTNAQILAAVPTGDSTKAGLATAALYQQVAQLNTTLGTVQSQISTLQSQVLNLQTPYIPFVAPAVSPLVLGNNVVIYELPIDRAATLKGFYFYMRDAGGVSLSLTFALSVNGTVVPNSPQAASATITTGAYTLPTPQVLAKGDRVQITQSVLAGTSASRGITSGYIVLTYQ